MTVSAIPNYATFTGSGSVGPFTFSFNFSADSEISVKTTDLDGVEETLTAVYEYTVTGAGGTTGGSVTLVSALTAGWTLTVTRTVALSQEVVLPNGGPYFAATIEAAFDKLTMIAQQLSTEIADVVPDVDAALASAVADGEADIETAKDAAIAEINAAVGVTNITELSAALVSMGTTEQGSIQLEPGLFTLAGNIDWSAYTNVTLKPMPGAVISNGVYSFNWGGKVDALPTQKWLSLGAGTVTLSGNVPILYPEWAGGIGDDTTDNSTALQFVFNNLSAGRKVVIGEGRWKFGTALAVTGSDTEIECRGTLVYTATDATTAITIGSSAEPRRMKGNIKIVDGNGTTWSTQKTGIEVIDLLYADLRFDIGSTGATSGGFYTGLKVTASTGNGNVYNNYRLGTIWDNKRGVVFNPEGTGWVNENIFYGGSFSIASTGHSGELADTYHIYIPSATNSPNNNRFIAPSFESDDLYCWFYNDGPYQVLLYPRMEGTPTYKIINGENGDYTHIHTSYLSGLFADPNNGVVDLSGNIVIDDTVSKTIGRRRFYSTTADPTAGTFRSGDILHNYAPTTYGSWSQKTCTTSGTYSSATDSTGDTDGSTAVITGMTDTSDFHEGEYVTVSAGFPSATTPYKIMAKTSSSLTLSTNSTSAQSNVTVATPDPVWAVTARAQASDAVQQINYASSITPDLSLGHILQVLTLSGNIEIANPTNTFVGQRFSIRLLADGSGRTITYGSNFKAATTSVSASKRIILDFLVIATNQIVQVNTPIECD